MFGVVVDACMHGRQNKSSRMINFIQSQHDQRCTKCENNIKPQGQREDFHRDVSFPIVKGILVVC